MQEKTLETGALGGEAAEFSKEIPDDDLEQVAGGDRITWKSGPGEFKIIPNPSKGFIRVVDAAPGIVRVSSVVGALLKQVDTTGGEVIIPMDGHGRGSYLVSQNGIIQQCMLL
jgi:hypothetical protein